MYVHVRTVHENVGLSQATNNLKRNYKIDVYPNLGIPLNTLQIITMFILLQIKYIFSFR